MNLRQIRARLKPPIWAPPRIPCENYELFCENLQWTGSYKVRAAFLLLEDLKQQGVKTAALASSGNFGGAFAYAGNRLGLPVKVVMMERTLPHKVREVERWGGEPVMCGNSTDERQKTLHELVAQGVTIVDHLTDPRVVDYHATLGIDLLDSGKPPKTVIVPVSTGGLLAGVAQAVKSEHPSAKIVGVQSEQADAAVQSFRAKKIVTRQDVQTICDALTANRPGELPFQRMLEYVDEMVTVTESAIEQAVVYLARRAKLVVEPGGAVGVAAVREGIISPNGAVVVLSGGNAAPSWLGELLRRFAD